jgi:hypothetical protein
MKGDPHDNNTDDDDGGVVEASARQREWVAIAAGVRGKLRDMVGLLPAMTPDETYRLIEAMSSALWLDVRANTIDKIVDTELSKLFTD